MWSLGDYPSVATHLEPCAIRLAGACGIGAGTTVLDVAAGNGNFAVAASRLGADVTASDFSPRMLELGRERTRVLGLDIEWADADAERLPFPDAGFDVVASVFGAMFAQRPEAVAAEMFRVCRPGGVVAMANYSWEGFLGATAKLLSKYSTPLPFELPSPFEWGTEDVVRRRFAGLANEVETVPATLTMTFSSLDAGLEFWERTNGPTLALRTTAPAERYAAFRADLRELMRSMNAARDGGLSLSSGYLEVVARK